MLWPVLPYPVAPSEPIAGGGHNADALIQPPSLASTLPDVARVAAVRPGQNVTVEGEAYACPIKFSIATVASDSSLSNRCPQTISCSRLSPRKRVCGPGGSRELRFSAPPRRLIRIRAIPRQRFFLLPSFRARPGAGAFPTTGIPAARTSTPRAFREPRDPVRRAAGPAKQ